MKPDRRIERTRKLIREALYELIIEKGYDAITVQEIITRANVARSSFYAHFRDKDDLLFDGFTRDLDAALRGRMFDPNTAPGTFPEFAKAILQSSTTHKTMVRALFTKDANSLTTNHLRNLMVVQIREWLHAHHDAQRQPLEIELAVHYLANALVGVLAWWVHTDLPHSEDEVNQVFNTLTLTGLSSLLATASTDTSFSNKTNN